MPQCFAAIVGGFHITGLVLHIVHVTHVVMHIHHRVIHGVIHLLMAHVNWSRIHKLAGHSRNS